jgi:hypothetical protein
MTKHKTEDYKISAVKYYLNNDRGDGYKKTCKIFDYPSTFQQAVNQKQAVEQQIPIEERRREQVLTEETTKLLQAEQAVQILINYATAEAEKLIREANSVAQTEIAIWEQTILDLDAEKTQIGLSFSDFIAYKEAVLIGDAKGAVVNVVILHNYNIYIKHLHNTITIKHNK